LYKIIQLGGLRHNGGGQVSAAKCPVTGADGHADRRRDRQTDVGQVIGSGSGKLNLGDVRTIKDGGRQVASGDITGGN